MRGGGGGGKLRELSANETCCLRPSMCKPCVQMKLLPMIHGRERAGTT